MRRTKLTAHLMVGGLPRDWIERLGVTALKWHAAFPSERPPAGVVGIGRPAHYAGFSPNGNPEDSARWYAEHVVAPAIRDVPWFEFWESPNEPEWNYNWPHAQKVLAMSWYARYMRRFALEMHRRGKRAVLGNWSVGNPEFDYWPYYVPALEAGPLYNAVLGRHSYSWLTEDLALRHRADNARFAALGFANAPVFITECGAEDDHGMKPWKIQWGGNLRAYAAEWLIPFEREIRKDPYVLAATLFTVGTGGSTKWDAYDVSGPEILDLLEPVASEPWPAQETPTPVPSGTHTVTATVLNVRQHPWLGQVVPAVVGKLAQGERVTVLDECRGWALIGGDGNRWVSAKWLRALGE